MLPLDVHIEGQNLEILPEWRAKIEEELARVQKHFFAPILHARVEIIGTGHHRHGAFEVHLVAAMPGNTLTVTRQGEFVLPLIVEAFDVLDRRLEEHSHIRQQKVKAHEEYAQQGQILKLFPEEDYGFIETADGLEVYFHANALKKGIFETLAVGRRVEFGVESGEKGPQATWVRVVE
jgi:cold shock CspA family protein/ribosome-associated translation inhibitor RaiA